MKSLFVAIKMKVRSCLPFGSTLLKRKLARSSSANLKKGTSFTGSTQGLISINSERSSGTSKESRQAQT